MLTITEWLRMPRTRVMPEEYETFFASFAGDVDLIQTRDLTLIHSLKMATRGAPSMPM